MKFVNLNTFNLQQEYYLENCQKITKKYFNFIAVTKIKFDYYSASKFAASIL